MSNRRQETIPARKPRAINRLVQMNPSKGLNNLVSPSLIDNREFSDSQNIQYDEGGVARKRDGYDQILGNLTAAKGLGMFVTESYRQVITIDNGAFKYATTGAWTTDATVSFTTTSEINFTQARNKLYIWSGTEGGSQWDGAALSRPGTMPKAKFGIYYSSYHIVSGVTGQPNRVYISVLADASDFTNAATTLMDATEVPGATVFAGTGANFVDVRPNDGDKITGLGRFQDSLVIFKEKSIYQLTFDSTGDPVVVAITSATGCVSHKSIETVENDLYFLSREGVRVLGNEPNFFTAIRTSVISIRIQPTIDGIDQQYYSKAAAHYFDNKYILSIPTGGSTINKTLAYDRRFQSWSIWTNFDANSMIQYVSSANAAYLYFLDDGGTKVYVVTPGTYTDDGTAIDCFLISKAFDLGNPDILKFFADVGLIFRRLNGRVTVSVYTDEGVTFGTATIGGGGNNGMGLKPLGMQTLGLGVATDGTTEQFSDVPQRVIVNTNSRTIKFKIANSRDLEGFVFLGYILAFYPYGHFNFDSSNKIYI